MVIQDQAVLISDFNLISLNCFQISNSHRTYFCLGSFAPNFPSYSIPRKISFCLLLTFQSDLSANNPWNPTDFSMQCNITRFIKPSQKKMSPYFYMRMKISFAQWLRGVLKDTSAGLVSGIIHKYSILFLQFDEFSLKLFLEMFRLHVHGVGLRMFNMKCNRFSVSVTRKGKRGGERGRGQIGTVFIWRGFTVIEAECYTEGRGEEGSGAGGR